ncbi:Protein FMP25, mitochondrial [Grifola frondosa]|uniref:Protein FMP25, mitochondrial n=1 Tax=Grifola frondosa TaxID=5627 RepID=A0A1C7MG79_GRIFR|nr:Protein FMP25, mitochondrial [Grifola frondosa]
MWRGACRSFSASGSRIASRRFSSQAVSSRGPSRTLIIATSTAVAVAGTLWYSGKPEVIHNDAPSPSSETAKGTNAPTPAAAGSEESLNTLVWGSNRAHLLSVDGELPESIRTPATAEWLENVALRDLALHEKHAACVDARGDVYQWGDGFFGGEAGFLLGEAATHVTREEYHASATDSRQRALQGGVPTPASTPWWSTGWMWGEEQEVDFAEILPSEKLAHGERFVDIAAGSDHLLALTSAGRTFAHPVSPNANSHGQLGFRKFDVAAPADPAHPHLPHGHARRQLELTPKAIADPYANVSPATRPANFPKEVAAAGDPDIRFSDRLFEVPALRGVKVDRIAAGARSSFVLTSTGRVLGWGANECGQLGLGGNVTLDAITVPTEIILWRTTPATMRTTCLDVVAGGDLTAFKVERADGSGMPYIDVLTCGNGQWGTLGNAQYSSAQGTPVRTKNISGLLEYSEVAKNLQAIMPQDISISPTGHILVTLDTMRLAGPGGVGRDVVAWGANYDYQLGNGKRGSVAIPTTVNTVERGS